jgi:hypothetical protein
MRGRVVPDGQNPKGEHGMAILRFTTKGKAHKEQGLAAAPARFDKSVAEASAAVAADGNEVVACIVLCKNGESYVWSPGDAGSKLPRTEPVECIPPHVSWNFPVMNVGLAQTFNPTCWAVFNMGGSVYYFPYPC